jgi:hypothetical protein
MRPENKQATAATVAPKHSTDGLYQRVSRQANTINEILTRLLFGLASPCVTLSERATVLDAIDGLIRLKIDAGLLGGGR